MYIPVILGTARLGRQSEKAAQFMLQKAREAGLECEIIDVRDYRLEATDNTEKSQPALNLAEKARRADGFIIVSPEYNHGYPGELKMLLDMLFSQYAHKPVGICGVSSGTWGGTRMVEQLRQVCLAFHMVPTGEAVHFPRVQELFDEAGLLKGNSQHGQAKRLLEELIWYARALKAGRETSSESY
ncbi:MAG: NAD(P)H-dependent oxidoreductase [Methanothrix sp.]|nr:NAD(P)H-dependent oxidoreductase [Methanothrix sp.]